jgi:hypothetical protein
MVRRLSETAGAFLVVVFLVVVAAKVELAKIITANRIANFFIFSPPFFVDLFTFK